MTWVAVGVAAVGAATSMNAEHQKSKALKKHNQGQAEMTRYSNWTGQAGEITPDTTDAVGAGVAGGMRGFQAGQGINSSMSGGGGGMSKPVSSAPASDPLNNSLGSAGMNSQIGQGPERLNAQFGGGAAEPKSMYSSMRQDNPYAANSFKFATKY